MKIKRNHLIMAGGILAVLAAFTIFRVISSAKSAASRRQNVPIVRVESPRRETVQYTLQYTGDVVANQQATIVARISGALERVEASLGSWVEQGQLLAVIDSAEVFQQAQQAAASFFTARSEHERAVKLLEQSLLSRQEFDNAEAQMKMAQANYELAKARLGYARVTAPFGGYITKRFFDPGAQVSAGSTSLFTLMDLSRVKVAVDLLEKDVPLVSIGQKTLVTADALPDKSCQGSVGRLSQAIDPATRTMRAEILVPNPGGQLKPGMYATVTIVLKENASAVTVPSQAVLSDNQAKYVFVLDKDSARRIVVITGRDQGAMTEITAGLNGSEQVITTGQQYVKDGGPVTVQPEADPQQPKPSGKKK
ncbi:MAG: efflux RND transporter periplasmic adaptor subunit [bacterium]|nr:efflux RND transporter periplasmic adaptor subunit [bacterium]